MPFLEIKIPKFNTKDLEIRLRRSLDRRGRRNENLLLRTTQYFETVKPVFQSEFEKVGDEWRVKTGPVEDESGLIWSYLDQGTSVRYAWMSSGYVAGTVPGSFETFPGTGSKRGLSIQFPAATEGIEARGWTELLAEQEEPRFAGELQNTIRDWLGKASRIISG